MVFILGLQIVPQAILFWSLFSIQNLAELIWKAQPCWIAVAFPYSCILTLWQIKQELLLPSILWCNLLNGVQYERPERILSSLVGHHFYDWVFDVLLWLSLCYIPSLILFPWKNIIDLLIKYCLPRMNFSHKQCYLKMIIMIYLQCRALKTNLIRRRW